VQSLNQLDYINVTLKRLNIEFKTSFRQQITNSETSLQTHYAVLIMLQRGKRGRECSTYIKLKQRIDATRNSAVAVKLREAIMCTQNIDMIIIT